MRSPAATWPPSSLPATPPIRRHCSVSREPACRVLERARRRQLRSTTRGSPGGPGPTAYTSTRVAPTCPPRSTALRPSAWSAPAAPSAATTRWPSGRPTPTTSSSAASTATKDAMRSSRRRSTSPKVGGLIASRTRHGRTRPSFRGRRRAGAGIEFVALSRAVWEHPAGPGAAVAEASALLAWRGDRGSEDDGASDCARLGARPGGAMAHERAAASSRRVALAAASALPPQRVVPPAPKPASPAASWRRPHPRSRPRRRRTPPVQALRAHATPAGAEPTPGLNAGGTSPTLPGGHRPRKPPVIEPARRTKPIAGDADLAYGAFQRGLYLAAPRPRSPAPKPATTPRRRCSA